MHSIVITIVSLATAAMAVLGFSVNPTWAILMLTTGVAVIGVPHGGLDHWTGHRLLHVRFPRIWPALFFPAYLAVGMLVVGGWLFAPVATAIAFFLVSAWHFGLEDEHRTGTGIAFEQLVAIAVGGLVIWIPMWTQSERVETLLTAILPRDIPVVVSTIMTATRWIAFAMLPIALAAILQDLGSSEGQYRALRNASFMFMFATVDVVLSFGIYFCAWHSIRGLQRLGREHGLQWHQLIWHAFPLSLGAIAMAAAGMWFWSTGMTMTDATVKTLFLVLSAIAVPHLILHGPLTSWLDHRLNRNRLDMARMQVSR